MMKRYKHHLIFILIIIVLLPFAGTAQVKVDRKIFIADSAATIMAPSILEEMSDIMWKTKYHRADRPENVLTDENGEVNLLVDMTTQPITESKVAAFKDFQLSQIKKARNDVNILSNGVKQVNGSTVAYFSFMSEAIDQKVFNYFFITVVKGKVLLGSFNCIESLKKDWLPVAEQVINSLTVRLK